MISAYSKSETLYMSVSLTRKHWARLRVVANEKRSSLLCRSVTVERLVAWSFWEFMPKVFLQLNHPFKIHSHSSTKLPSTVIIGACTINFFRVVIYNIITNADWLTEWGTPRARPHFLLACLVHARERERGRERVSEKEWEMARKRETYRERERESEKEREREL
jgi:hypothetical protein